ncbi:hypothetical protein STEG23_011977 [Scotinomys teguina]
MVSYDAIRGKLGVSQLCKPRLNLEKQTDVMDSRQLDMQMERHVDNMQSFSKGIDLAFNVLIILLHASFEFSKAKDSIIAPRQDPDQQEQDTTPESFCGN